MATAGRRRQDHPARHLVATKVTPPVERQPLVHRERLHEILDRGARGRLTLVDAPAGWGKTTLVGDWLRHRRVVSAWLSLDADDSDSTRFWSYVIAAIRTIRPGFGAAVLESLHTPRSPPIGAALPQLINDLAEVDEDLVVVLDDYHVITNEQVHAGLVYLLDHLPANAHLLLLTRSDPPFPVARWQVRGDVVQIRADDLRFDVADAGTLLDDLLGVDLPAASVTALHERTEGWVAGLCLAALSLRTHPDPDSFIKDFAGDDRHVVDYLVTEVLDNEPEPFRHFLVRTSVLERLSGPLCDAVLATTGSNAVLAEIERTNHFLVPLDTRRQWYRYHQLFGELLRLELDRTGADLVELHRRAAAWHLDQGQIADGIRHTILSHDEAAAADLIAEHWPEFLQRGELSAVVGWLDALGDEAVRADARLCLIRAWATINTGRVGDLDDWIEAAERAATERARHDRVTMTAAAAMLRCIERYLNGDTATAIAVANEARALEVEEIPPWRSVGCPVLGIAQFWSGHSAQSASTLRAAIAIAEAAGNHIAVTHGLGCLALAAATGDGGADQAYELAERAVANSAAHGFRLHWTNAMARLAIGKVLLRRGDLDGGARSIEQAVDLSRRGVARIELAYGLLTLAEIELRSGRGAQAATLVEEAGEALAHCRDPGLVADLSHDLAAHVGRGSLRAARSVGMGNELTDRELAVLALLPTELNLREVASTLYVSINTVKSQTRAIYRKLGVSDRSAAVARARQLGLA